MSEFDIAATATAEAASPSQGAEVEGQGAPGGDQPATGGDVTSNPQSIPYDRFQEVVTERNDLRTRTAQLDPFLPLFQTAQQMGLTPDQMAQRLFLQQGQPQQPQADPLTEYLSARGFEPEFMSPEQIAAHRQDYTYQQQVRSFMETQAQQQAQQTWGMAVHQAVTAHPILGEDQTLRDTAVQAAFAQDPTGRTLPQVARQVAEAAERIIDARVARYAAAKTADAHFPVTAGGSSPAPVEAVDFHNMGPAEKSKFLRDWEATQTRDR